MSAAGVNRPTGVMSANDACARPTGREGAAQMRERVVQIAREWIGTPFLAGECRKGRGCDCGSLIAGVMAEAGAIVDMPALGKYDHLAPAMRGDGFYLAQMRDFALGIHESRIQPGDIVMYRLGRAFSHAAIICDWTREVIHAVSGQGVIASHGCAGRLAGHQRLFFRMKGIK